jgi:Asp-tRNA(Asn)/Glu-tRNA(Gln) amidotransferase A subunit family amidase
MSAPSAYDLQSPDLPRLEGAGLALLIRLLDSPLRQLVMPRLLRDIGITSLRGQDFDEPPTFIPLHPGGMPQPDGAAVPHDEWPGASPPPATGFRFTSIHDYAGAYREGRTSPDEVAARVLLAISESNDDNPSLRAVIAANREDILRQARAATERIRNGRALGIFDGVPVGVKDEVDLIGYPTTAGTAFLGRQAATMDATVVARMRAAGALLIGKTNMHEIGIGVTGLNAHHGTPRNPYAMDRHTGGSSSGSAAAVAAGLCPLAIAADGGGSIRIPAALCGVVGLKPTYGRVSEHGAVPLCWSVAHLGPIGATVTDAALGYAVMAGADRNDPVSMHQPAPTLQGSTAADLAGVTLGVFRPWFEDADDEIVGCCEKLLGQLVECGATLREIILPDLEAARVAHAIAICGEMAQAMSATYARHHRQHGQDVRVNLRIARSLTALDYIKAQRVRTRLMANFRRVFAEVDAIITPATGCLAPLVPDLAPGSGYSDISTAMKLMRFATPANLTGLPAISFPAGFSATGLPIGMQAIGRAWEEALLLRIAKAGEACVDRLAPQRHFQPLADFTHIPTP